MSLQSLALSIQALCLRVEERVRSHERECNCGCALFATVQCVWCGEWYAEGCVRGYCFEEAGAICGFCKRDHKNECDGCSEKARAVRLEDQADECRSRCGAEEDAASAKAPSYRSVCLGPRSQPLKAGAGCENFLQPSGLPNDTNIDTRARPLEER